MNWALPSFHWGSLEITRTFPLTVRTFSELCQLIIEKTLALVLIKRKFEDDQHYSFYWLIGYLWWSRFWCRLSRILKRKVQESFVVWISLKGTDSFGVLSRFTLYSLYVYYTVLSSSCLKVNPVLYDKIWFILSARPTVRGAGQAVQYTYRGQKGEYAKWIRSF